MSPSDKELIPRKLPFPPNDEFGNYEPTITSDGNTIYFARFANTGDKRVRGKGSDIFVTHRIRQSGEWPGTARLMVFVHYDPATKEWKGPIVDAPFNQPNIDGSCPMFTVDGDKMIWSAGYDRGPGPVADADGNGSVYDLFWLKTSDVVAYYKAKAGLS